MSVQPSVHGLRVALTVADFDAAVRLFRDGFGLPVVQQWTVGAGRGIVLAAGPDTTIELLNTTEVTRVDGIEAGGTPSGVVRLAFAVADVATVAGAAQAAGAQAVHAAVPTPWGDYNQRLATPDGLQITLYQPGAVEATQNT
jgi:catechol 2,3-dioxygenase-like lactoylglutathione lyase family enzyme